MGSRTTLGGRWWPMLVGMLLVLSSVASVAAQSNTFPSAGNTGIGTMNPDVPLKITMNGELLTGTMNLGFRLLNGAGTRGVFLGYDTSGTIGVIGAEQTDGSLAFWTSSSSDGGWRERMRLSNRGFLGIGTLNPDTPFKIVRDGNPLVGTANLSFRLLNGGASSGVFLGYDSSAPIGIIGAEQVNGTLAFWTNNGNTGWAERMRVTNVGSVGIGTAAPAAMLHVVGDARVDGNIAAKYQDVAEWVKAPRALPAGTVVVIDTGDNNRVVPSDHPYDARVAGVVSSKPGVLLGQPSEDAAKIAQSGRVMVKVDASYGSIVVGDLLVTSPTPGHAMRSQPVTVGSIAIHQPGTLLGKALEPLKEGQGEILVLLTLQ